MKKRNRSGKFVELAEKRVNRLLGNLDLISNLSNQSNYEYNDEQLEKIMDAIDDGVSKVKSLFKQNVKRKKKFKL
tara:strand:+ start:139 stop:363 length:225 start_codon:yes stop_codon:yes gene_type:complete